MVTGFTDYRWPISQHLSCLAFILTPSLQSATYSFPKGYLRRHILKLLTAPLPYYQSLFRSLYLDS